MNYSEEYDYELDDYLALDRDDPELRETEPVPVVPSLDTDLANDVQLDDDATRLQLRLNHQQHNLHNNNTNDDDGNDGDPRVNKVEETNMSQTRREIVNDLAGFVVAKAKSSDSKPWNDLATDVCQALDDSSEVTGLFERNPVFVQGDVQWINETTGQVFSRDLFYTRDVLWNLMQTNKWFRRIDAPKYVPPPLVPVGQSNATFRKTCVDGDLQQFRAIVASFHDDLESPPLQNLLLFRDNVGRTVLHAMADQPRDDFVLHRLEILEALLGLGADVNCIDNTDATPLFYAARTGNTEMCQLFIEHGAEARLSSVNGWSCTLWAGSNGFEGTRARLNEVLNIKFLSPTAASQVFLFDNDLGQVKPVPITLSWYHPVRKHSYRVVFVLKLAVKQPVERVVINGNYTPTASSDGICELNWSLANHLKLLDRIEPDACGYFEVEFIPNPAIRAKSQNVFAYNTECKALIQARDTGEEKEESS